MIDKEKRELLEAIKKLPPEKQTYVAGVAAGLAISVPEPPAKKKRTRKKAAQPTK